MQDLFNPTLRAIHSNEDLFDRLSDLPVVNSFLTLSAKVGLDGSRLNSKRQQLSGEVDDDNSLASSDSFLDVTFFYGRILSQTLFSTRNK